MVLQPDFNDELTMRCNHRHLKLVYTTFTPINIIIDKLFVSSQNHTNSNILRSSKTNYEGKFQCILLSFEFIEGQWRLIK